MKNELKNYLKELSEAKKSSIPTSISNVTNNNNHITTGENIMGNNSLESSKYSSFA